MARRLVEVQVAEGEKLTSVKALALLIRERRMALGLSQEALADEGLEQAYISKLERGESQISVETFLILARRLQTTPVELFTAMVERMEAVK